MVDIIKDKEIMIETIAMRKVLEGLIHNVNSQLNIILGYSQQLAKQYPELIKLNTIYEAGLEIDNLMQSCTQNLNQRIQHKHQDVSLADWLKAEIKFLMNVLEIKHSVSIETFIPTGSLIAEVNPLFLGLYFESVVLHIVRCLITSTDKRLVKISIAKAESNAEISLALTDKIIDKNKIEEYFSELQAEIIRLAQSEAEEKFEPQWVFCSEQELKLIIPLKD
jgi:TPP-dependent 2-oxoacid decarboxylase